jgi:hypothetical protein
MGNLRTEREPRRSTYGHDLSMSVIAIFQQLADGRMMLACLKLDANRLAFVGHEYRARDDRGGFVDARLRRFVELPAARVCCPS